MTEQSNEHPRTPSRVATMVASGSEQTEAIDCGHGIFENKGIGSSYLVTTPDGNVLVNTGTLRDAKRGKALFEAVSAKPIHKIILTQSHVNQYGGLELYKTIENEVIAHRIYPDDLRYNALLADHYRRGSRRIFGGITGSAEDLLPTQAISPDKLIDGDDRFELGGRQFDLLWTPGGETRSALVVWLPQSRVAIVGNLFGPLFGNQPNLNTLRGDKPRSALEFIESVKRLRALAPTQILTGHENICGESHINASLTRIIESVQWVHDQTVAGMNEGKTLSALMSEVRPPAELALTEEYGKVSWNVRAIWHEYTGWYDPTSGITGLYPDSTAAIEPTLIALCGGQDALVEAARSQCANDQPLAALKLLDILTRANICSNDIQQTRRLALELLQQARDDNNLWERRFIAAALAELDSSSR